MVSCLSSIGAEEDDSSLADDPAETFERGHAYIKRFGVACSAIRSNNPAISWFPEYRLYYAHKIVQWPCGKVICHTVKYTRDH